MLWARKILVGKTLANDNQFAKFANIFPRPIIALYGICNTFTPKIKGIQGVACLMLPWFEGNIFDVALVRGQHRDVTLALQRLC